MKWNTLGDIRLLVVDDDAFNRQLIISLLGKVPSINFFQAEDGEEALNILTKRPVDMVLLDLHMPKMDGYATLKAIKDNPEYDSIPIAIITTDEQEMHKLFLLGADDFISKPFKLSELESRIYAHVEKKQDHTINKKEKLEKKSIKVKSHTNNELKQTAVTIESIETAQKETFYTMAKLLNKKEGNLNNIKIIATLAKALSHLMGYDQNQANAISYATAIRNIGAISLSEKIPSAYQLSNQEKEIYQQCIRQGYQLLKNSIETDFIKIAKKVIAQHKEHYDGSGFPHQLKGDEIHKVAYIAAIVETFDALLSQKDYHNQKIHSTQETYDILQTQSAKRLHPQIVKLFLANFKYFIQLRKQIINQNL
ncbi:response regulator [bacterium]|nr:response regulator [bacterium]MBU1958899.1 response regulator [bacterium]